MDGKRSTPRLESERYPTGAEVEVRGTVEVRVAGKNIASPLRRGKHRPTVIRAKRWPPMCVGSKSYAVSASWRARRKTSDE